MSEQTTAAPEGDEPTIQRSELDLLDEQLRETLGEDRFLVDIVQAGLAAKEFRASLIGKAITRRALAQIGEAFAALVDIGRTNEEHALALRKLQVQYAALRSILEPIADGRLAETNIEMRLLP